MQDDDDTPHCKGDERCEMMIAISNKDERVAEKERE